MKLLELQYFKFQDLKKENSGLSWFSFDLYNGEPILQFAIA